ncbi:hypothetical protein KC872_01215 [Candidatus Kaiserbacteria bacterium]|nr:hypothetical protein [Candidatus Kaiserbacteria bacterium]
MNIKKVLKYLVIVVCIAIIILLLAAYSSAKSDYRTAGKHCDNYAREQAGSRGGMVTLYEPLYVSCMRSNGYLLDVREMESN